MYSVGRSAMKSVCSGAREARSGVYLCGGTPARVIEARPSISLQRDRTDAEGERDGDREGRAVRVTLVRRAARRRREVDEADHMLDACRHRGVARQTRRAASSMRSAANNLERTDDAERTDSTEGTEGVRTQEVPLEESGRGMSSGESGHANESRWLGDAQSSRRALLECGWWKARGRRNDAEELEQGQSWETAYAQTAKFCRLFTNFSEDPGGPVRNKLISDDRTIESFLEAVGKSYLRVQPSFTCLLVGRIDPWIKFFPISNFFHIILFLDTIPVFRRVGCTRNNAPPWKTKISTHSLYCTTFDLKQTQAAFSRNTGDEGPVGLQELRNLDLVRCRITGRHAGRILPHLRSSNPLVVKLRVTDIYGIVIVPGRLIKRSPMPATKVHAAGWVLLWSMNDGGLWASDVYSGSRVIDFQLGYAGFDDSISKRGIIIERASSPLNLTRVARAAVCLKTRNRDHNNGNPNANANGKAGSDALVDFFAAMATNSLPSRRAWLNAIRIDAQNPRNEKINFNIVQIAKSTKILTEIPEMIETDTRVLEGGDIGV
ncbi:hypothetical protein C8R44DRAFT_754912 [Mycena epipterygia]|nr:hypothetical protein C8R44DRAFT_754912 [Mycena epipterygia]